jgi:hypothetical protein
MKAQTLEELFNCKPEPTRLQFMEHCHMNINQCANSLDLYDLWKQKIIEVDGEMVKLTPIGLEIAQRMEVKNAS